MRKLFKMKELHLDVTIPKWYGVAYRDYMRDVTICYPRRREGFYYVKN